MLKKSNHSSMIALILYYFLLLPPSRLKRDGSRYVDILSPSGLIILRSHRLRRAGLIILLKRLNLKVFKLKTTSLKVALLFLFLTLTATREDTSGSRYSFGRELG